MGVIKPKKELNVKKDLRISKDSSEILKQYSMYTGYEENELVDMILNKLLFDNAFRDWVQSRADKKKITKIINNAENSGSDLDSGNFYGNMLRNSISTQIEAEPFFDILFSKKNIINTKEELQTLGLFKDDE